MTSQNQWISKSTRVGFFKGSTINLKHCQSKFACSTLLVYSGHISTRTHFPSSCSCSVSHTQSRFDADHHIDLKYGALLLLINLHVCRALFLSPSLTHRHTTLAQTRIHICSVSVDRLVHPFAPLSYIARTTDNSQAITHSMQDQTCCAMHLDKTRKLANSATSDNRKKITIVMNE